MRFIFDYLKEFGSDVKDAYLITVSDINDFLPGQSPVRGRVVFWLCLILFFWAVYVIGPIVVHTALLYCFIRRAALTRTRSRNNRRR
jgi:hypothetical protein